MKENLRLEPIFTKEIKDLIIEGLEITRLCQEDDVIHLPNNTESNFYVWEQQDRYIIWKSTCRQVLYGAGYIDSIFEEADSISITSGAIVQMEIEPTSPKGQKMLRNIRKETSNKLAFLRNVIKDISGAEQLSQPENSKDTIIKVVGKKGRFSFNQITGSTIFNNLKTNFPPDQQKFIILKIIMISSDNQGTYKVMCKEINQEEGIVSERKIQLIMRDIKKELKIIPKNKKSMPDIFKSVSKIGYRLDLD